MSTDRPGVPMAGRVLLSMVLIWFARLEHDPLVRLEAVLGLSPSPLEWLFGIKGLFSGMTEAAHRLSLGDLHDAVAANFLFVPLAGLTVGALILGWRPRIRNGRDDKFFFAAVVLLTLLLNMKHAL